MKKDNLGYLIGGIAFGFLLGFGTFNLLHDRPAKQLARAAGEATPAPAGPMAPTQMGQAGGAPMIEEINSLKRVLQSDPNNLRALVRLGNIYHDAGMCGQAVGFYEKSIEVNPRDPNVLTDTGACYQVLQQFDRALDYFDRAQAADPRHWQSLYNRAVVLGFNLGRFDEAEAALRKIDEFQPSMPQVVQLRQALAEARAGRPAGS